MDNGITSAIFLKKVGSGMHNYPERERCYIDARKNRFWNAVLACVLKKNF
jgi:hypothetical protein